MRIMKSKMIRGATYTRYTAAIATGGMRRMNATNTNAATSEMPQIRRYLERWLRSSDSESSFGVMSAM